MIEGFFSLILEVWNQDFLGISIGNVVISIGIIVFSIILRAIVISRVFKFLENLEDIDVSKQLEKSFTKKLF